MPRKITDLIVVCSSGHGLDNESTTVRELERDARERGFSGIRYHYVITKDGTVHTGREQDAVGAHTVDELGTLDGFPQSNISVNGRSVGVCVVGSIEDPWTRAQLAALAYLLTDLQADYPGAVVMPDAAFNGHSPSMLDFKDWGDLYGITTA